MGSLVSLYNISISATIPSLRLAQKHGLHGVVRIVSLAEARVITHDTWKLSRNGQPWRKSQINDLEREKQEYV